MPQDLVLLTGATGFVGFSVLTELLDKGYNDVRLVVRSKSKIDEIKNVLPSKYAVESFSFAIVSDLGVDGALDSAVKGVTYIIHVASPGPAPAEDFEESHIKPAVNNTLSVLRSATKEPGIKKVVITSSIAAIFPSTQDPFDADHVEPTPKGPYPDPFTAYIASKKAALNATRKFTEEENPHFSVINIMPSFVIGQNSYATTKERFLAGSNSVALGPLLGVKNPGHPTPGCVCHIDDVGFVHVAALRPDVSGHRNFGATWNGPSNIEWNDVVDIVRKRLPDVVEKGVFPMGGDVATQKLPFEASKTESVLGIKFKPFEEMVVDMARDFARVAGLQSSLPLSEQVSSRAPS